MTLDPETIASNYDKYRSLIEKIGDSAELALSMVDALGERLALFVLPDVEAIQSSGLLDLSKASC